MGMGTPTGQVFFNPQMGQYYTQTPAGIGYANGGVGYQYTKKYIGNLLQQTQQNTSPINELIAKAAAAQANAPTMQSLFPTMTPSMLNVGSYGNYGAGRFLAPNASQFGNPAQSMSGFAPNVIANTK